MRCGGEGKAKWGSQYLIWCLRTQIPTRVWGMFTDWWLTVYCRSVKEVGALWPWPATAGSVCSPSLKLVLLYIVSTPTSFFDLKAVRPVLIWISTYPLGPGCLDTASEKRGGLLVTASFGSGRWGDNLMELLMPRFLPFLIWGKPVKRGPLAPLWKDRKLVRAVPDPGGDPYGKAALGSPHLGTWRHSRGGHTGHLLSEFG